MNFNTVTTLFYLKLLQHNNIDLANTYNELGKDALDYYNNKKYNLALSKLQQLKNLFRSNNLLDKDIEDELDKLHNLVVSEM